MVLFPFQVLPKVWLASHLSLLLLINYSSLFSSHKKIPRKYFVEVCKMAMEPWAIYYMANHSHGKSGKMSQHHNKPTSFWDKLFF
jgi:hypothetical protein